MMSLFSELKRRNVFRVAVAYLVAAWVIAQVADLVLDNIGAPPWVMQTLLLVLALGFIAAVGFSWAYEVTPEGIRREGDLASDETFKRDTARRLVIITIGLLIVAIGLILTDRLILSRVDRAAALEKPVAESSAQGQPKDEAGVDHPTPELSIAVLPFIALTADESDAYFGKGVAEELLNALARLPNLKVAARTSAFSFTGNDVDLREVGEALNVANVLEGSVRRSGDRVRITAQLIRAADGFHLWSDSFERRFTDIFQIQDEIVAELSRVLQIRLGVGAGAGRAANRRIDPEAYELYLRGLDLWWTREVAGHRAAAIETFLRVTELGPDFSDGWAAYAESVAFSDVTYAPHLKPGEINDKVSAAFARALEIDPENPRALAGLVYWHLNRQIDIPAANRYLDRALAFGPNYGFTNYAAAQFYFSVGDELRATRAINRAIVADPLNDTLRRIQFQHNAAFGRYDPASPFLEGMEDCVEQGCGMGHWFKAWMVLVAALHAADENEIRDMRDIFHSVFSSLGDSADSVRASHELLIAYTDGVLGDDAHEDYWRNLDFLSLEPARTFVLDASILAQQGLDEQALTVMERVTKSGRFFASRGITYVLTPGRFEIPEHIRRHPRYHALWTLPGMPEIELARRANGMTAGLPLPVEETNP